MNYQKDDYNWCVKIVGFCAFFLLVFFCLFVRAHDWTDKEIVEAIYKAEGAEGMWLKAGLPTPPTEVKAR